MLSELDRPKPAIVCAALDDARACEELDAAGDERKLSKQGVSAVDRLR
jgi:hypothetical protein